MLRLRLPRGDKEVGSGVRGWRYLLIRVLFIVKPSFKIPVQKFRHAE